MLNKTFSWPSASGVASNRIVGFFPGLGSRAAYQNIGRALLDCEFQDVKDVYQEAAEALGHRSQPEKLLMVPENLPAGKLEQLGFIGAGLLVHNLALDAYLRSVARKKCVPMQFIAYTGESFGVIASAVASGSLSCRDGVKIAQVFTPLMMMAAEGEEAMDAFCESVVSYLPDSWRNKKLVSEPFHVCALKGAADDLANALDGIKKFYLKSDVEVHKFYSWNQTNIYVRTSIKQGFDLFMKNFPLVQVEELKAPTKFLAHSDRMRSVRLALEGFIDSNGIVFNDAAVPVISNHGQGLLKTGQEVRNSILAIVDEVMASRETVAELGNMNPDIVLELGLGGKSVQLLIDNHCEVPVMAYSGADDETEQLLQAMMLVGDVHKELENLHASEDQLRQPHYDMLREIFLRASSSPFHKRYLFRAMTGILTKEMLHGRRERSPAYYRFLEIFQHTYRHRKSIHINKGELILQARLKKTIEGRQEQLGRVYAELKVIDANGGAANQSFLSHVEPTEVVVFHFEQLEKLDLASLVRNTRLLLETQSIAREIYDQMLKMLRVGDDGFLRLTGGTVLTADQMAISYIVYQYTLFQTFRLYRPAIFTQRDFYLEGSDPMGWLVALAIAGAGSLTDIVELYCAYLRSGAGSDEVGIALERLFVSFKGSDIPVIAPEGHPIQSRKDLEAATRSVFQTRGGMADGCCLRLSDNCHIISLGAYLPAERVDTGAYKASIISLSHPMEIWKRHANLELDEFDDLCVSTLTDDNEKVMRYAQSRRLLSNTVYAYVSMEEKIVGFGKGGSESMTMFLTREDDNEIIVRKTLSEALTAAHWDPKGKGVMLPPFAKAKKQAEYLQALPDSVRPYFPMVHHILERSIPIPSHLQKNDKTSNKEVIYEMSYVPGEEVSRFVEKNSPAPVIVSRIYSEIFHFLTRSVHAVNRAPAPGETLDISYFKKIEDRLALSARTAPVVFDKNLLGTEQIVINGTPYLNLLALVRHFRERPEFLRVLEPRFHSLVMGDTNTENIKMTETGPLLHAQRLIDEGADATAIDEALQAITADSLGIKFLDPRAIGFENDGAETCDDAMYDNKPWHNSLGHYDEIHYEYFRIQVQTGEGKIPCVDIQFVEDNPFQKSYRIRDCVEKGLDVRPEKEALGMEDYFGPVMASVYGLAEADSQALRDDPYWLIRLVFVMGTHFAAMPPFHFQSELDGSLIDNYQTQRRPVAIYCEGVKWLNWALEMLEGRRREFLGIPVPPLPYRLSSQGDLWSPREERGATEFEMA
ncbi:hypothetical protein [Chromobacterium vaccinii]|uniref:hypothetical protein n=1 Tax=Chromobacterium vaccinii TaxID=1108595 RepID=UPI000A4A3E7A|nr:hypothetical protein [Chromobacterium vaccinii]